VGVLVDLVSPSLMASKDLESKGPLLSHTINAS